MQRDITTMQKRPRRFRHLMQLTAMLLTLVVDAVCFLRLCLRSLAFLAAENLFLRNHAQAIVACDFYVTITATFIGYQCISVWQHARFWVACITNIGWQRRRHKDICEQAR